MSTKREHDIGRFDTWSDTYEQSWMQRVLFERVHQAALALVASVVQSPASVLDVGCGTGKLLRQAHLRWPDARLVGVDPASGMIEMAARLTPEATYFTGMAEALPLPDSSIQLALSTLSFHHWQDQAAGLREIARVLEPGGCLLLADGSFPGWLARALRQRRIHSRAELQMLFHQAGLTVRTQQKVAWRGLLATVGQK